MSPRPRNQRNRLLPPNLYPEMRNGKQWYRFRNPRTGKRTWFGTDRFKAINMAHAANARLDVVSDPVERALGIADTGGSTRRVTHAVTAFKADYLPTRKLAASTRKEYERILDAFAAKLGNHGIRALHIEPIATYLDGLPTAASNRQRNVLIQLFRFCRAKGWVDFNPAEATLVKVEDVQRQRLTLEQYQAIHAAAPANIQNAMDLSLQTLQARLEISRMSRADVSRDADGSRRLKVVRQKTAGRTRTAYLSIAVGPELQAVLDRCTSLASPYFVRGLRYRRGQSMPLKPGSISQGFAAARDATGLFESMPPAQRPTFHEIRALGADLMRRAGRDEAEIQALLGHTDAKMTGLYLSGHEPEFVKVEAARLKV